MAKKGVRAVFSKDQKTLTVWCYPSVRGGGTYKLSQHTWANSCPFCGKKLKFNPKNVPEGEITCGSCDADFCGVTGKDKAKKCRRKLKPATVTPNSTTNVAGSKTQSQKCELSKAEAKTKAKSLLKTSNPFKASMTIPIIPNVRLGDPVQIDLKGFESTKKKTLHISELKEDIDNQTYQITLAEGKGAYENKYDGEYILKDSNGGLITSSGKNPYQAKCETVNANIGVKDNSTISKKIKLKGQELGTIKKIYKWLRVKSGGGTGGWKYKAYTGHKVKADDETKWSTKSAEKCWSTKTANCVDFSWIMAMMGKGAGKTVGIKRGTYKELTGESKGHMWNTYKGKNYDCSSSTDKTIDMKKVEKV